ncbi:hypothetical protein [Methanosalsum natronophilum]|uniref:hypothetical protein n=1 Tax=Methanosalsum natronophilum TaxID=768733 RepID=UPI002167FD6B|nr:hypothetical protein [Methanosalsum natronophilum]
MTLDIDSILAKSGTLTKENMREVDDKLIEMITHNCFHYYKVCFFGCALNISE